MTVQFHYFLRMKSQPHISFTTRYCIKVHLIVACRRYSKLHYPKFYIYIYIYIYIFSPITGPRCPEGSRKLRFQDYVTMAQDGGKVVSLTHRPCLPPGNTPGTHFR